MATSAPNSSVPSEKRRTLLLSLNFSLLIAAYYQVKPVTRSVFISSAGSENLPYVWILTTAVLLGLMPFYHWRARRHGGVESLAASGICFILFLALFRFVLPFASPGRVGPAVAFYVLVDVYSVVLIEQCWSLMNSTYRVESGKKWYGLLGGGGLFGSMWGSALSSALLGLGAIESLDLLLLCALLTAVFLLTSIKLLGGEGSDADQLQESMQDRDVRPLSVNISYVVLITYLALAAQLVEPLIEYQFMNTVESSIPGLEARTGYLTNFYFALSLIALGINITITPVVLRRIGLRGGLSMQPLAIIAASLVFAFTPVLLVASMLKFCDRGFSYSVNRASRELLYIPLGRQVLQQLKAWIDMFGYRLFKIVGSLVILVLMEWTAVIASVQELVYPVIAICLIWLFACSRVSTLSPFNAEAGG